MPDFGCGAVRTVEDSTVVDQPQSDAFTQQIIGERAFGQLGVEQELRQCTGSCILLHEYRHVEGRAEFVDEVDLPPALHGGDESGMAGVPQIRARDGHTHGDDVRIVGDELPDGATDLLHGVGDVLFADGG